MASRWIFWTRPVTSGGSQNGIKSEMLELMDDPDPDIRDWATFGVGVQGNAEHLVTAAAAGGVASLLLPSTASAVAVFAFGLVAFGFLGMGPVTIAVDSYGPVTDNAPIHCFCFAIGVPGAGPIDYTNH